VHRAVVRITDTMRGQHMQAKEAVLPFNAKVVATFDDLPSQIKQTAHDQDEKDY
jgi:hypothetical protein